MQLNDIINSIQKLLKEAQQKNINIHQDYKTSLPRTIDELQDIEFALRYELQRIEAYPETNLPQIRSVRELSRDIYARNDALYRFAFGNGIDPSEYISNHYSPYTTLENLVAEEKTHIIMLKNYGFDIENQRNIIMGQIKDAKQKGLVVDPSYLNFEHEVMPYVLDNYIDALGYELSRPRQDASDNAIAPVEVAFKTEKAPLKVEFFDLTKKAYEVGLPYTYNYPERIEPLRMEIAKLKELFTLNNFKTTDEYKTEMIGLITKANAMKIGLDEKYLPSNGSYLDLVNAYSSLNFALSTKNGLSYVPNSDPKDKNLQVSSPEIVMNYVSSQIDLLRKSAKKLNIDISSIPPAKRRFLMPDLLQEYESLKAQCLSSQGLGANQKKLTELIQKARKIGLEVPTQYDDIGLTDLDDAVYAIDHKLKNVGKTRNIPTLATLKMQAFDEYVKLRKEAKKLKLNLEGIADLNKEASLIEISNAIENLRYLIPEKQSTNEQCSVEMNFE